MVFGGSSFLRLCRQPVGRDHSTCPLPQDSASSSTTLPPLSHHLTARPPQETPPTMRQQRAGRHPRRHRGPLSPQHAGHGAWSVPEPLLQRCPSESASANRRSVSFVGTSKPASGAWQGFTPRLVSEIVSRRGTAGLEAGLAGFDCQSGAGGVTLNRIRVCPHQTRHLYPLPFHDHERDVALRSTAGQHVSSSLGAHGDVASSRGPPADGMKPSTCRSRGHSRPGLTEETVELKAHSGTMRSERGNEQPQPVACACCLCGVIQHGRKNTCV